MSDLIRRDDVLQVLTRVEKVHLYKVIGDRDSYSPYNEAWDDCVSLIELNLKQVPSVKPERKTGKWIEENRRPKSGTFYCSVCHRTAYDPQPTRIDGWVKRCRYSFCPNCGADMRGDR